MSTLNRPCARPGCRNLVEPVSAHAWNQSYCSPNCQLIVQIQRQTERRGGQPRTPRLPMTRLQMLWAYVDLLGRLRGTAARKTRADLADRMQRCYAEITDEARSGEYTASPSLRS